MLATLSLLTLSSVLTLVHPVPLNGPNPPDTWCGKAYRPGDPAIDPGGRIQPPILSKTPLLDLKVQPRYSIYLADDGRGSFIVDTSLSYIRGQPYPSDNNDAVTEASTSGIPNNTVTVRGNDAVPINNIVTGNVAVNNVAVNKRVTSSSTVNAIAGELSITISRSDTGKQIATANVNANVSDNEINISLKDFKPSFDPYAIEVVTTGSSSGKSSYKATTQLYRLPEPVAPASVIRIDRLYGALVMYEDKKWVPFLPYSFFLGSGEVGPDATNLRNFARHGYNVLHVIPPYDYDWFDKVVDEAETLGMRIMYDMRYTYQSPAEVTKQIARYSKRKSMLLWYTADEPDGNVDPLNAPKDGYDLIKSLDPYHPISICLNCANYHFEEYSAGADILLSDVYPISTNTSWSTEYHTVCNETYGCCGCDNCHGEDDPTNVANRLDQMQAFQTQLGQMQRPIWAVPQAFGASQFWKRVPTRNEEAVMTMLSINHGAKGIMMWMFPTTKELTDLTEWLGKVLINRCTQWILGTKIVRGLPIYGGEGVDASAWIGNGEMLVSIVNPSQKAQLGTLTVELPNDFVAQGVSDVLFGDGAWRVGEDSMQLKRQGMPALGVDLFTIKGIGGIKQVVSSNVGVTS